MITTFREYAANRDQEEDVRQRILTALGLDADADEALNDPLDNWGNRDELKKELEAMEISPDIRASALTALEKGKIPLGDFINMLQGSDPGDNTKKPLGDQPQVPNPPPNRIEPEHGTPTGASASGGPAPPSPVQ